MKANRNYISIRDDRAEVGVGTLIVFIAMVLVAAVAAAVLINTSGTLQERATSTGREATQEVSSNLKVVGVYGIRNTTASAQNINHLHINLELSAGAPNVDLTELVLRFSDGTNTAHYKYGHFRTNWIRGVNSTAVMKAGDLVELNITMPHTAGLGERVSVEVLLIPEAGTPVPADFKTPPTYGDKKAITLR